MLRDKEIIENLDLGDERIYRNEGERMTTVDVYPLLEYQLAQFKAYVEAVKNPYSAFAAAAWQCAEDMRQAIIKGLE